MVVNAKYREVLLSLINQQCSNCNIWVLRKLETDRLHKVDEMRMFVVNRQTQIGKQNITTGQFPFLLEQVWCGCLYLWGDLVVIGVAFSY